MPNAQGFDHSFGHMGGCIDNYSHFFYWSGPNIHDLWRNGAEVFHYGEFFPDLMVDEAARFMEQHRDQPFFIYFALNMPHYPYQGDAKWLERFKDLPYPRNLYAAFLAAQDERLGKLFANVDDLGLRERTIIVFQSDNGHSTEERAHFGGGSAGPYRGGEVQPVRGRHPAARDHLVARPYAAERDARPGRPRLRLAAYAGGTRRCQAARREARRPQFGECPARMRMPPARTRIIPCTGRWARDRTPIGPCAKGTGSSSATHATPRTGSNR